MPRRAATTIVLITRHELVRADFARGSPPALVGFWSQPRPELPDHAALVEAAFSLGPKPGRQVWVLNSDLWTQTLAIPASRTAGLAGTDLGNALNFEAEGFSGHSAFDSAVAFAPQGSSGMDKLYWLIQTPTIDIEMIDEAVRKAGSRLAGILHPAGVPQPLVERRSGEAAWLRAELWCDVVVTLQSQPSGPALAHVVNSAPELGQWQSGWDHLRGSHGAASHTELLLDGGVATPAAATGKALVRLDDETTLQGWLTAWAMALGSKTLPVPCLRPARRSLTAGQRRAATMALTAFAVLVCGAHFMLVEAALKETQEQIQAAGEPAQKLANLHKQAKDTSVNLQKETKKQTTARDKAKAEFEKLVAQVQHLEMQRERLARLLAALSDTKNLPEHLFIEKIDDEGGEPRIHGVCWEPQLADQFASKLSLELRQWGWTLEAPKKKTAEVVPGGGPCTFSIQFRAMGIPTIDPQLTTGKAGTKAFP